MIGFYIFLVLEKFLMFLPKEWRKSFFISLGRLGYRLSKRYRDVVRNNLLFVYGEKNIDTAFIEKISRNAFELILLNFMHTMQAKYYSKDEMREQFEFENTDIVEKIKKENRSIIFITAHYGAWELGGSMVSSFVEPLTTVYKGMKNPYFNNYLSEARSRWNVKYLEKHGAMRGLVRELRNKRTIALLIDTNVTKEDPLSVDFLNHKVSHVKTTAYLARKFDAAIVPVLMHPQEDGKYILKFYDEIITQKTEDIEADILASTSAQASWLSTEILKAPEHWFWLHRRFKRDYPHIYT